MGIAQFPVVVVVVGADAAAIHDAVGPARKNCRLVVNPDFERGQLTSLLTGLRVVERPGVTAVLVTLIDAPLISEKGVRDLIAAYRKHKALIVRPGKNGKHGHPVIFDRRLFDELHHTDLSRGAKSVVHAHAADIFEVPTDEEGAFIDIDTKEDYERWIGPLPDLTN